MSSATLTSRSSARRRSPSPRQPEFVDQALRPLAARAAEGEDHRVLVEELYDRHVHGWAMAQARRMTAGLPPHADRAEVVSQALRLAWEACLKIDWNRVESWPTLLERKVSHARIEAARSEDWLSRRERVHRRTYQRALAGLEQRLGREPTPAEREILAREVSPASGRVDWARELLEGKHPSTVAEMPEVNGDSDVATTVEEQLEREASAEALRRWLSLLSATEPQLADQLLAWQDRAGEAERAIPARLARKLQPYTPLLAGLVVP